MKKFLLLLLAVFIGNAWIAMSQGKRSFLAGFTKSGEEQRTYLTNSVNTRQPQSEQASKTAAVNQSTAGLNPKEAKALVPQASLLNTKVINAIPPEELKAKALDTDPEPELEAYFSDTSAEESEESEYGDAYRAEVRFESRRLERRVMAQ